MNTVSLDEVADVIRGVTFSKAEGETFPSPDRLPVIRAGSIQQELHLDEGQIWVPAEKIKPHQKIRRDDIIMCTSSGSSDLVGKCAKSEQDYDGSFGAFCAGIRTDSQVMNPSYLFHFLRSPSFRRWTSSSSGANIKNIRLSELAKFQIPAPTIREQKRIAAILDKADNLRRKRQQAIQLADEFLRAVFLEMFGDPMTSSKPWMRKTLQEIVAEGTSITYGIVQAGPEVEGGVPYIRTGDFKDGLLAESGYARTSQEIASKFERSKVLEGDLVYCIRASIGSVDIVPKALEGANLTQGTARIAPGPEVLSEYLVEYLRTKGFRHWVYRQSKGATFKEITLGRLRDAPVLVPPMAEQRKFAAIRMKVLQDLKTKMNSSQEPLFDALSQRAFQGEL